MRVRQFASVGLLLSCAVGGTFVGAQQPGVGQTPSSLPLTAPIRERGSSVTPAFEGWFKNPDGSLVTVLFNSTASAATTTVALGGGTTVQAQVPAQGWATIYWKG